MCSKRSPVFLLPLLLGFFFFCDDGPDDQPQAEPAVAVAEEGWQEAPTAEAQSVLADDTMIDRRFGVSAGDVLEVRVALADIEMTTSRDGEVRVEVLMDRRRRDADDAREYFESMDWRVEQTGDRVRVTSEEPPRRYMRGNWGNRRPNLKVVVHHPERFNLDVHTSYGDVEAGDLDGRGELKTSYGDIEVGTFRGPDINLDTSYGDVVARALAAEDVRVHTSYGDIELGEAIGAEVEVNTSYGDIEIGALEGRADVATSYGDVEARLMKPAAASFETSYGDVVVEVPDRFAADLDLRGSQVRIDSDLTFAGSLKKKRADGRINGGGELLSARSSHGTVVVERD